MIINITSDGHDDDHPPRMILRGFLLLATLGWVVTEGESYYQDPVTPRPNVTPPPSPPSHHKTDQDIIRSLCPPKQPKPIKSSGKNLLIVSTLDGHITALDLNKVSEKLGKFCEFRPP